MPREPQSQDGPIRSVKEFVKRYFPNAEECPHCHGTGIKSGSGSKITRRPCTCATNFRGPCPRHGGIVLPEEGSNAA